MDAIKNILGNLDKNTLESIVKLSPRLGNSSQKIPDLPPTLEYLEYEEYSVSLLIVGVATTLILIVWYTTIGVINYSKIKKETKDSVNAVNKFIMGEIGVIPVIFIFWVTILAGYYIIIGLMNLDTELNKFGPLAGITKILLKVLGVKAL